MVDVNTARYLSFTTQGTFDVAHGEVLADEIRLELAAAFESGAEIDTTIPRHEVDWLFYGVRDGLKFTVVLVEVLPRVWFTFVEGARAEDLPEPEVRTWALAIIESTLAARTDVQNLRWHRSHRTLPQR